MDRELARLPLNDDASEATTMRGCWLPCASERQPIAGKVRLSPEVFRRKKEVIGPF
jgi:hypothetical protein